MKGRIAVLLIGLFVAGPLATCVSRASAADRGAPTPASPMKADDLRQILIKGLRVTRPDQEKYIDEIVKMVVEGDLSLRVVFAAYRWSRDRRLTYPFPYFVFAVNRLAKLDAQNRTR